MKTTVSAALAIIAATLAVVGMVLRANEPAAVQPGRNGPVNAAGLIEAHNSPSLARDPRHPGSVVVTDRVDRPGFSAGLSWSTNDGRTWSHTALPLPRGLDRPYAPDVAFAPDGTLYVTYVNLSGTGNVPANLWLSKSSDGGRTLSVPVRIAGKLTFQARLAVDRAGVVHVTWLQADEVGLLSFAGPPAPIVAASSADRGRTFSRPVRVSDPRRALVGAASPVIDSEGRLAVLYEDFKDDRRDFENLDGPPWDRPFSLVVTRPVGSRAFAAGVELERNVVPTHRFLAFLPEFPSLAAGAGNTLYAAWSDGRNGDEDVFLRRSRDGGATWSAAQRINDNPLHDKTSQYLPRVAVAPDGRVDVLYLDRRRDPRNVMTDATLAASADGTSFRNVRLSTRSFDSRIGASSAPRLPIDFGSRLALASDDERSLAAWTDTRLGSSATGRQDVFAADYTTRSASLLTRAPVIAILAGLAAALAAGSLIRRGRLRRERVSS